MDSLLYLVFPQSAESGTLETMPDTKGMRVIREDEFLELSIETINSSKICITSEAALESVTSKIDNTSKALGIKAMKDKYLFRDLLKDRFPSLKYQAVELNEISNLNLTSKKILKPIKGCFGTAVKTIDDKSDIDRVLEEIKVELSKNSAILSERVLSPSKFILEDYIDGKEYAVDMFFDAKGNPHIVSIYYHPIPKYSEYLHMIYCISKNVFEKIYESAISFFIQINKKLQLKNITLHSEFKFFKELIPIEINPMRFGGMGLGNMVYHSLKINPYRQFQNEQSPDWAKIWQQYPDENFVFFIAYNGTKIDLNKQKPNFLKMESQFSKILNKTVFNYQKQLAFGIYTLQESSENIEKLLQIDFNNYFENIK